MSNFERKQQTQLMKRLGKVPRNTPEKDLELGERLNSLRSALTNCLISSAQGRISLIAYAQSCIINSVKKADFIVNLNSSKEADEGGEESKKSIQIIEELVSTLLAIDDTNLEELRAKVSKHRFAIKTYQFCASAMQIEDLTTSKELNSLTKDYIKVRETLCLPHMRLVHKLAQQFQIRTFCHDLEDLTSQGWEGLIIAADRFDSKLGLHFGTYASNWIKQVISRYIMDTGSIVRHPVHLAENINDIMSKKTKLENKTGLAPTIEEVAAATNLPVEKVQRAYSAMYQTVSLDAPVSPEFGQVTFTEFVTDPDASTQEDHATNKEMRMLINELINDTLDERAIKVIKLRFGLGGGEEMTSLAVASLIDRSRERTRQVEAESIKMLRARRRVNALKDYL